MPYADPERRREYHREYDRQWRAKHPDKIAAGNRRTRERLNWNAYMREWRRRKVETDPRYSLRCRVRRDYGLTLEEYDALIAKGCAICGEAATGIDHCHATRRVRGALCNGCNTGLGMFADDIHRMLAAVEYVKRPPTEAA